MVKDPYLAERRAYHLSKKYADEKLEEAKQFAVAQVEALPEPEPPREIPVAEIAAEVMALLPKEKKLKNKKKGKKGIPVVTPEDVMAMIMASLEDVNEKYVKEGDTIVINEAPIKVIETVREIVRETGGDVDFDAIKKLLDEKVLALRETIRPFGGSQSLRLMPDVNLDGVPTDAQGNYLLGSVGGSSSDTFETVSKNLKDYPHSINYTGGRISSVVYTVPAGTITKTISYNVDDRISTVVLSGDLPATVTKPTKTITYSGGRISSVAYS